MKIDLILRLIVVTQLALGPTFTFAGVATASPEQVRKMHLLGNAIFDYAAAISAIVQTPAQFERYVLSGLKPEDRRAIVERVRVLKKIPAIYLKGQFLVIDSGSEKLSIKFADPVKYAFEVNGVPWVLDLDRPLSAQMNDLDRGLKIRKNAFYEMMLPDAEALGPIAAALIGIAAGLLSNALGDGATEVACMVFTTAQRCLDLKKTREEAMFKKSPALDAVLNQSGGDKSNVLVQYESEEWECPAQNDGKQRIYRGRIRHVELKGGKKVPTSGWYNVVATFAPDGTPTDVVITDPNTDPKTMIENASGDDWQKLSVHVTFDPTTHKPIAYRVPNPNFDKGNKFLNNKPTIVMTPIMSLGTNEANEMNEANDSISFINYKIYNCVAAKVTADANAGIDPGSPTKPKAETSQ